VSAIFSAVPTQIRTGLIDKLHVSLEIQVPVFISPKVRVTQLFIQALGFIFVASYDAQGYGRVIITRLLRGKTGM
jgi:hypothetical protein